ncbi:helix-turn-helix transcriptional regulator [Streptomyces sp. NA04227]|uniref:helix-turn-helix domain-containing protein n=1 Tax=Streptomyces sp. NA04227 TaxID=2742136 RepID=UPI001590FB47|nr:helix-turn-helix transcriptional regulator [Streptomyces sp. NA04227]QKW08068.1 helix-turn-helix transcriptional regulator [Streptomyces sp. NA04227]
MNATASVALARTFGAFVKAAALKAGYPVDDQRSGARSRLAVDAGMSPATVSRILNGQSLPDPNHLEGLSRAIHVPVSQLLVRSGVVSEGALSGAAPSAVPPLSVEDIAEALGIRSPNNVELLRGLVRTLQQTEGIDESGHGGEQAHTR